MNDSQLEDILNGLRELTHDLYNDGRDKDGDEMRNLIDILEKQRDWNLFEIQTSLQLQWGRDGVKEKHLPFFLQEANKTLFVRGINLELEGYTLNASLENGCLILFLSE